MAPPTRLETEENAQILQAWQEFLSGSDRLCNSTKNLEVHHRTYANLGCEEHADLVVLCDFCHGKHHDELPKVPHE